MDGFHEFWLHATKAAEDRMARAGRPADRTRGVVHLNQVNFPAAVALLGNGGTKERSATTFSRPPPRRLRSSRLLQGGIDAASAERMLKAFWVHRSNPRDVLSDEALLGAEKWESILQAMVNLTQAHGSSVDCARSQRPRLRHTGST
jgi:hypothetical protein